ncbi:MAG: protein kinase, partial [Planctomycetes bacterium]|nr:protein kinase [Planctomycetota bacterium]
MTDQDPILSRSAPLGPYTIVRKLGQGGMGGVYLGMHKVLQVHHAIKVIHPRLVADPKVLERFMREARHAAKLNHPNIVPVLGADTVDGIPYIAMPYVDGKTLSQIAAQSPLSVHASVRYVHMVANALAYAHSRKVIHRDIKPANIMVDEDNVAKLMDFGLVRDMSQNAEPGATSDQLTMAGLIVGTPQYMPPEQWHGEGLDHRCDIFSLGATLYFLVSGNFPYPGRNTQEIFRAIMAGKPIPLAQRVAGISPELAAIVDRAVQCDADARHATAGEFATALEQWWASNPPGSGTKQLMAQAASASGATVAPTRDGTLLAVKPGHTRSVSRGGSTLDIATIRTRPGTESSIAASGAGATNPPAPATATSQSSQTLLQAPASNKTILVAAGIIVLVLGALGIGLYAALGGSQNSPANTPAPAPNLPPVVALEFRVDLAPDAALESNPLRVASAAFSIPGASNGRVTLNGNAYEFGSAVTLQRGLNKLELAATGEADARQSRTLFVVCDPDAPVLEVPAVEQAADGRIPLDAASFTLRGTLRDDDAQATIELSVDGRAREVTRN